MASHDFINILIAEDQDLVRAGIKLSLARLPGLVVVGEARNGEEAVSQTLELNPDVVLMDAEMPGLNGTEATRLIKAAMPAVRVLILTSHDHEAAVVRACLAGADGYCLKTGTLRGLDLAIRSIFLGAFWLDPGVPRTILGLLSGGASHHASRADFSTQPSP